MSTHRHIDQICCAVLAAVLVLTLLFIHAESLGIQPADAAIGYESRLFDTSRVHTLDIVIDDWDDFLSHCTDEEYVACSVIIDQEAYKNVGLRAKGNTSLTQVQAYGNDRYSFKIEFDHYDRSKSYHGLDKLCLNNIIQDNTYMKDYLCYRLMGDFGVSAPLCSYVYLTVNGEDWGLYLAVEGVEEAFLSRNYGDDYGKLYKPDSMDMGGGHGNGRNFRMEEWEGPTKEGRPSAEEAGFPFFFQPEGDPSAEGGSFQPPGQPEDSAQPQEKSAPAAALPSSDGTGSGIPEAPAASGRQNREGREGRPGFPGGMGSSDVSLVYTDDSHDSYPNIFENAKTSLSQSDKDRLIAALKNINENVQIPSSVDVEQVIRYFVVHNFVLNFDSYTGSMIHNYYLYEEDGRLSMIPWDYNLAFGGFGSSSSAESLINYPMDSPVSGGSIESRPMLAWIFASEEYTALYHRYFSEFIAGQFESGAFSEMIRSVKEMIAPYVESDPTKFCTYEEFMTGIDTLEQFCLLRAESIRGQLEGSIASTSEGQQSGENLIPADGLSVSAMGSMHNTMGKGGRDGRFQPPSEPPEGFPSGSFSEGRGFGSPEGSGPPEQASEISRPPEDGGMEPFLRTGRQENPALDPVSPKGWITLGASAGLLLLGIGAALLFRRRAR